MAAVEPTSTLPGQNNAFAYSEIIHQMVFDFNFLFPLMALAESNISASMEVGPSSTFTWIKTQKAFSDNSVKSGKRCKR